MKVSIAPALTLASLVLLSGEAGATTITLSDLGQVSPTFILLWGSPNSYNTVTLYSGTNGTGSVIGTVSFQDGQGYFVNGVQNSVAHGPNTTGPGNIIAISSTLAFQSAILANAIGGFEVADLSARAARADPTPLPAALPLFATGLGALGLLGWRRKRKSIAAAMGG